MPTGPSDSTYIIPPLTLSDTFYEWYKLTNEEVIDKLNRMKVYQVAGATGIATSTATNGVATVYLDTVVPGDHTFTGNITFDGTVTTVNTNLITIDDYNLVLGAVGACGGGTTDSIITNAGGGGIVIAGVSGEKYFLWKAFEGGRTYSAWRISDSLAFTGDAKFYSGNNRFILSEGDDSTPASQLRITTHSGGSTIDVETVFSGTTHSNLVFLNDGTSKLINGSIHKRFTNPIGGITGIGLTFGMVVRHDTNTNGVTLALADNVNNAESIGVVSGFSIGDRTVDVNMLGYMSGNFSSAIASYDSMSVLGTGEFYFLSDTEPGKISKSAPTLTGKVRKPILYALGGDSAMVMNYVGSKIVDYDALYTKISNGAVIIIGHTANAFAVGDVVRFEETLTSGEYPNGSYVKADSASSERAEALGIVSKINYSGVATSSLVTTSGFIDLFDSGKTYSPGQVYFLGNDGQLTLDPPTTAGTVRKPMMVALSPTTGLVQNYVGVIVGGAAKPDEDSGTSISTTFIQDDRNRVKNANFENWPYGTTFAYRNPLSQPDRVSADSWIMLNNGGTTAERLNVEVQRLPIGLGELGTDSTTFSKYGLRFAIGTGGYTATSQTYLYQKMTDIQDLVKGNATVSFYAKSSQQNAKLGVSFRRDFGGGTAPDYSTTGLTREQKDAGAVFNLNNSWQKYSHTFNLPSAAGGTLGTSGTDGTELRFFLRSGASGPALKNTSESINPNLSGVVSYTIDIAQVQFEPGNAATEFENEYSQIFQATSLTGGFENFSSGYAEISDNVIMQWGFVKLSDFENYYSGNLRCPITWPKTGSVPWVVHVTPVLNSADDNSYATDKWGQVANITANGCVIMLQAANNAAGNLIGGNWSAIGPK